MPDSPLTFLVDPSATPSTATPAPATNRPNTALYTTQGGVVQLGVDASGVARVPRVDQYGSQTVISTNPAGTSATVYTGSTPGATTAQYGTPIMLRMDLPTPSTWQAATADPTGSLNVHCKSKPSWSGIATAVIPAASKSMLSLMNASTSSVVRLNALYFYVPPAGISAALLGQGSVPYYPLVAEIRRISSATAGTSVTPATCDTGDTLPSGITMMTGATVSTAYTLIARADAVANTANGLPFYQRADANAKVMVIRPGEGFSLTVSSTYAGFVGAPAGGTTSTPSCDVTAVFTVAGA